LGFKDSKIQDSNIQIFKDSKIQGFKDSKIQRFKDSRIQRFEDLKGRRGVPDSDWEAWGCFGRDARPCVFIRSE
jgi:hypothetical protein